MKDKSTLEFWLDDIDQVETDELEEAKKKKKNPYSSIKVGNFDPEFETMMFNKHMGTDGYVNGTIKPGQLDAAGHLVSGSSAGEGSGEAAGGEGCCEGLNEDTAYVSRHEAEYEFPPKVHLLPQNQVEKFILDLDVKENFRIGVITPLELYTAVNDYFDLFKATEMNGYTGIDYRDDTIDADDEHQAERIAKAKQQIADQDNLAKNADGTLHGHQMDRNTDFSTSYRAGGANKLGTNSVKANMYNDIELNRILFYIDPVNADIKNRYFARLYNTNTKTWTDWFDADRDYMEKTVFNAIVTQAAYKQIHIDEKDKKVLKKLQLTPEEFEEKYPGISVKDFVYCQQQGFDVFEWTKEHPFSRRWGIKELKAKLHKVLFAEDEATITDSDVTSQTGLDRFTNDKGQSIYNKEKANVRALYTNQIYYISGRPGTFGKVLTESVKNNGQTLTEAKRYVRRYYIRPQEIFCSNKADIIKALIDIGDENCSVYTLNNLGDVKDVTKLTNDDIIYYYDDGILYDKNKIKVMDYDLYVKHEEERDKINPDQVSDATFKDHYNDRITDITNPNEVDESLEEDFNLSFDSVNAYGEILQEGKEHHTCCICGEEFNGYGNNPAPVKDSGVCCDSCNMHFVIPARLEQEHEEKNEELKK